MFWMFSMTNISILVTLYVDYKQTAGLPLEQKCWPPINSVWTAPGEKKTRRNYKPRTYVYRWNRPVFPWGKKWVADFLPGEKMASGFYPRGRNQLAISFPGETLAGGKNSLLHRDNICKKFTATPKLYCEGLFVEDRIIYLLLQCCSIILIKYYDENATFFKFYLNIYISGEKSIYIRFTHTIC